MQSTANTTIEKRISNLTWCGLSLLIKRRKEFLARQNKSETADRILSAMVREEERKAHESYLIGRRLRM